MDIIELTSDEEETTETLRVLWSESMKIHWFDIGMKEPLHEVFNSLAKEYGLKPEEVLLVRNGAEIQPTDSLHSLGIGILDDIIALKNPISSADQLAELSTAGSAKIQVKVQEKSRRKPLVFYLRGDQPLHLLIQACAKDVKVPEDRISIKFEGQTISHSDTLKSLDIDDEVVMDLYK